ncbi:MAG: DAK2 domain-containing protein [Actinomycetia bacterium]|nr:DAK2 domain-containing protein [Actinomycetes bacterium]
MPLATERTEPAPVAARVDAALWRAWWRAAGEAVAAWADTLDALNVFPVPDRDTGKNLRATLHAGLAALEAERSDAVPVLGRALARGALEGARGNSGTILSQWIRGVVEGLAGADDPGALARALARGAATARAQVLEPVDGTMLTVMEAAARAAAGGTVDAVVKQALAAAEVALAETPGRLSVLARHGVVDAGALGWVLILRAWAGVLAGDPTPPPRPTVAPPPAAAPSAEPVDWAHPYEIQAVLGPGGADIAAVKAAGAAWGDSLVVGHDLDGRIRVHVHTAEPLPVVAALARLGPIRRLEWTDMRPDAAGTPAVVAARAWQPLLRALGLAPLDPAPVHDRPGVVWIAPECPPAAALGVEGIGAAVRATLAYDPEEPWAGARDRLGRLVAGWRDLVITKEARGYRPAGGEPLSLEALAPVVEAWVRSGGSVTVLLGPEVTPEEARWWAVRLPAGDVLTVEESPAWAVLVRE